jgi:hypothetical protein
MDACAKAKRCECTNSTPTADLDGKNGVICGSAGNPTFEKLDHGCGSASDFHRLPLQNAKSVGITANKVKIPARV